MRYDLPNRNTSVRPVLNILVPTGLVGRSHIALLHAVNIAQFRKARLFLLNIVELPVTGSNGDALGIDTLLKSARRSMDRLCRMIPHGIETERIVRIGVADSAHEIIRAARNTSADLIIVTTHSCGGSVFVTRGTNTEVVIRHATCPVLVVREWPKNLREDRINETRYGGRKMAGLMPGRQTSPKASRRSVA